MAVSAETIYQILTGEDDGRLCKDIPEEACLAQPQNFTTHVMSLAATKTGDGLADPKLVLAWLLGALGAPQAAIGLLVPVREAGALLPQLFTSAQIRALPKRKWAWVAGSAVQGLSVFGMAAAALTLKGAAAGWTIVGLLAVFAIARSVCSVSYKDVLGKTVAKQSRGTATGTAGSIAAAFVFGFGMVLALGIIPLSVTSILWALVVAGALWIFAALNFLRIAEEVGATAGGVNAADGLWGQFAYLKDDPQLVRLIAVRGLLIATALAPPFLLALAGQSGGRELAALGPFVIASALASVVSGYVWGRFADHSSRQVLMTAAAGGGVVLGVTAFIAFAMPSLTTVTLVMAGLLSANMIAYQGVRLGRSTHLVDMTDEDRRVAYTALSNTAIGALLIAGGGFGVLADYAGVRVVLGVFAAMCAVAFVLAIGLEEVQQG
jgi:hypothetical protein